MFLAKKRLLIAGSALAGFVIAAADYAYLEYTFHHHLSLGDLPFLLSLCLDPPSFLSVVFIDTRPTETQVAVMWSFIALANSALYASLSALVAHRLGTQAVG
jgi:hypothetical protein